MLLARRQKLLLPAAALAFDIFTVSVGKELSELKHRDPRQIGGKQCKESSLETWLPDACSQNSALVNCANAAPAAVVAPDSIARDGRDQPFDEDWRFFRGDAEGLARQTLDDSRWRRLDLPHDWSIEDLVTRPTAANAVIGEADTAPLWQPVRAESIGPFDAEGAAPGIGALTGFTVGGVGWYRKHFRPLPLAPDARVEIVFDGVYMNAEIWLNGVIIGKHPYGYAPFGLDLTAHLNRTGDNVLAVRVQNIGRTSRWYSGSGIYRHVWLNITGELRFARWGLAVTTPSVSVDAAQVQVRARIRGVVPGATLVTRIRDAAGRVVAEARTAAQDEVVGTLALAGPQLWSPAKPVLYLAECELFASDRRVDRMATTFGVRRVEIDAQQGLRINGEPYKLRGGCVHHDNGLLGAVAIDRAEERRVELLKARGYNAIRTSHNPPSPAFLDACDRLGMLVLEEAFDVWNESKTPADYSLYFKDWWRQDLAAMVLRDGNHPSVILWSIGNEIREKTKPEGVASARMLAQELRRLDPTRPVSAAINGSNGPDLTRADGKPDQAATQYLDVSGYNYKLDDYERDHLRFPERVILGTESFPKDVDAIWRLTEANPYLIGDFVWTAMDYLGEAGIGSTALSIGSDSSPALSIGSDSSPYPWFNAFCGDIDLIGQQKPQSLLRDVVWGVSALEMCVQRPLPEGRTERPSDWGWRDELQSWTWPGAEGKPLTVNLYTRGDKVRLELNGHMVAERAVTAADESTISIGVPYAAGRLVATAFREGGLIGRRVLETAGSPVAVRLDVDRSRIAASRNDLAFVSIEIVDVSGRLVPDAVRPLQAMLSGPAELAGFGNANPRGVASFQQPVAKTWHGRALAIVRPTGKPGLVTLTIGSEGLKLATARMMLGVGQREEGGPTSAP